MRTGMLATCRLCSYSRSVQRSRASLHSLYQEKESAKDWASLTLLSACVSVPALNHVRKLMPRNGRTMKSLTLTPAGIAGTFQYSVAFNLLKKRKQPEPPKHELVSTSCNDIHPLHLVKAISKPAATQLAYKPCKLEDAGHKPFNLLISCF